MKADVDRPLKPYLVFAEDESRALGQVVEATSHAAAAVGFAELHGSPLDAAEEVRLVVRGLDDLRQHCFVIDMGADRARPC